jgi:hypothetical protein
MRAPLLVLALLPACGSGEAAVPGAPAPAVLDVFDAVLLENARDVAPTFAEVAEPKDETPRRFRAWLGWSPFMCLRAQLGDAGDYAPCSGAYVCVRPSRVVLCQGDEIISTSVMNEPDGPPFAGPYVFEGAWKSVHPGSPPEFEITKISWMTREDAGIGP